MKEKIKQLAEGIFEYESPFLVLSEKELIITVDAGGCYTGSLTVENSLGTMVQGQCYSTGTFLALKNKEFEGIRSEITFTVQGRNLAPGDMIRGELHIVSNSGEGKIPYYISAEPPYLNSSLGKIKDFFHFTNLAKTDWAEAVKLFKSEEFRDFLKFRDKKYLTLYDGLRKSRSYSQALEEFQVTVRKKTPVNIIVDKNIIEYEVSTESFMDKVTLMKDNWGYEEIRVTWDGDFINPEHKIIWSDYFVGNIYPLEFVILPEKMRRGKNYGRLILTSVHETIVVEIVAVKKSEEKENIRKKPQIREKVTACVRNYLDFRKNLLSPEEYTEKTEVELHGLKVGDRQNLMWYKLLEIHLIQVKDKDSEERQEELKEALNTIKAEILEGKETSLAIVCAFWYLTALIYKNSEASEAALKEIQAAYRMNSSDYRILWFLLYTDKKYESNKNQALDMIKNQYYNGCRSPYMYLEAFMILREHPVYLTELGDFETQLILFGVKEEYISEELAGQFAYLAGKKRDFTRGVYLCLSLLYNHFSELDNKADTSVLTGILSAICSLLIKGHKRGRKYFVWYQLGVQEQLRITELYEYYLYSLEEEQYTLLQSKLPQNKLPQQVLLYFIYNSSLSDKKKAFLYAYVIKNKEELGPIYKSYCKKVENFAGRMLKEHAIDRNYAVIYEELITLNGLTEEISRELPYVMFKQELCCSNNAVKGVITIHGQTGEEVYTPLVSNIAYIDLYMENYEILLVDSQDNRYSNTIEYTLYPFFNKDSYLKDCLLYNSRNTMVLLYYADKIDTYQKFDQASVVIRRKLLDVPSLNESYRGKLLMELVSYYYDNFQGELLEEYLMQIDLTKLNKNDRLKVTELLIIRNYNEEAEKALYEFGFEGIQINRLLKVAINLLGKYTDKNEFLLKLCYFIYKAGKYNEEILLYLAEYYEGTTGELYSLWEAALSFEINTCVLEERLLTQMLVTREYLLNSPEVFLKYYQRGSNRKLIRAFLSYHGYKYLMNGRILKAELFNVMKRELIYEENDVCMLALLKKLSEEEFFDESEKEFVDYNLQSFLRRGIILPFFKNFKGVIPLNPKITEKYLVEYIADPSSKVIIHYRLENKEEEFTAEEMKDMFLGIRVKDFTVFQDENLQYYISEGDSLHTNITESGSIKAEQEMQLEEDTPLDQINFILTAFEMNDNTSVLDSMWNYGKNRHLIMDLFKPI